MRAPPPLPQATSVCTPQDRGDAHKHRARAVMEEGPAEMGEEEEEEEEGEGAAAAAAGANGRAPAPTPQPPQPSTDVPAYTTPPNYGATPASIVVTAAENAKQKWDSYAPTTRKGYQGRWREYSRWHQFQYAVEAPVDPLTGFMWVDRFQGTLHITWMAAMRKTSGEVSFSRPSPHPSPFPSTCVRVQMVSVRSALNYLITAHHAVARTAFPSHPRAADKIGTADAVCTVPL